MMTTQSRAHRRYVQLGCVQLILGEEIQTSEYFLQILSVPLLASSCPLWFNL